MNSKIKYLPWVLIPIGPILLFGPMLVRGETLFWGTPLLQFVPWRECAFQVIQQGHLPLWNPNLGMGAPLLANYQSALFYPPNLILWITGAAWGHGLLVMIHLIWAGLGMVILCRHLGFGSLAQTIAGLSFSLSGYLVARGGFLSINAAAAWMPWIILMIDRLVKQVQNGKWGKPQIKAILWLSVVLAMQWFAGHAQTAWYTMAAALTWGIWRSFQWSGWRGTLRFVTMTVSAGVLGLLLSAVQMLPTLEYLVHSQRAGALDPEFALGYSFWPWRLLGLLMPNLFGNPARGSYWGYGNYWEDAIYIGILPLAFAAAAIWQGLRGKGIHTRFIRFLLLISVIVFILALGKNTPIFPYLYRYMPTFDLFQAPTRWNLIFVFYLSILAALGIEGWRPPEGRALYWTRLGVAGTAVIGFAAWLGSTLIANIDQGFVQSFVIAGLFLLVTGALTLITPRTASWKWATVVGAVVLADLLFAGVGLNPSEPIGLYRGESQLTDLVGSNHRLYMPSEVEFELKFEWSHRFDTFQPDFNWRDVREVGLPNTPVLDGIASANNFDPILPERYATWVEQLDSLPVPQQSKLLALMDVGWVAVRDDQTELGIRYDQVVDVKRVRLVPNAVVVDSPENVLAQMLSNEFEPGTTVFIEEYPQNNPPQGGDEAEYVWRETSHPGEVQIEVMSDQGSWLVLSDLWYPGWIAKIDGEVSPHYRANYLFRAVWVPVGGHELTFSYQPMSFRLGGILSLLSWIALGWVGWRWREE